MRDAYIYDAVRTPRGKGKMDGSLHEVSPIQLLTNVLTAVRQRNVLDTSEVDDVVIGCVTAVGEQGADIARAAVLYDGWSETTGGVTLNRFCASGLEAVNLAAMKVMSGQEDLVVGGGVESMSRVPMASDGGAWFLDPRVNNRLNFVPQGVGADLIATLEGFSRKDVDSFAVRSHRLAHEAQQAGHFARSIVPVKDINGLVVLEQDETIRPQTTLESLSNLKPSFIQPGEMGFDAAAISRYPTVEQINHVHHAGNSSGIVDGAALILIGSKEKGLAMGLKPRARIRACAVSGADSTIMLTGPAPASLKALKKAGMTVADIDLIEVNEAFASVVLRAVRDLRLDMDKVNVNGGAIAMGHPLGATGAMLVGSVLDELERRNRQTALITLCVGMGMGIATIIERV